LVSLTWSSGVSQADKKNTPAHFVVGGKMEKGGSRRRTVSHCRRHFGKFVASAYKCINTQIHGQKGCAHTYVYLCKHTYLPFSFIFPPLYNRLVCYCSVCEDYNLSVCACLYMYVCISAYIGKYRICMTKSFRFSLIFILIMMSRFLLIATDE